MGSNQIGYLDFLERQNSLHRKVQPTVDSMRHFLNKDFTPSTAAGVIKIARGYCGATFEFGGRLLRNTPHHLIFELSKLCFHLDKIGALKCVL